MATAQRDTLLRYIQKLGRDRGAPPASDRQLLDAFSIRRDEAAFAALVARHGPMVLRVCRRVLGLRDKGCENLPSFEPAPFGTTFGLGPGAWHGFTAGRAITDKTGCFRLDGLLPGGRYFVVANLERIGSGKPVSHRRERVTVEAGAVNDLGDFKPLPEPE